MARHPMTGYSTVQYSSMTGMRQKIKPRGGDKAKRTPCTVSRNIFQVRLTTHVLVHQPRNVPGAVYQRPRLYDRVLY